MAFAADQPGAAVALAIGIGLQNIPEGLAIALPLRREGMSRWRAFYYGQLSAIIEPVAGVLGAALALARVRYRPPKYDGNGMSRMVRSPGSAAITFGIEFTVIDAVATSPCTPPAILE